jgi:hypothetical protein
MSKRWLGCGRCGQLAKRRELTTPPTAPTAVARRWQGGPVFGDQMVLFSMITDQAE